MTETELYSPITKAYLEFLGFCIGLIHGDYCEVISIDEDDPRIGVFLLSKVHTALNQGFIDSDDFWEFLDVPEYYQAG